MKNTLYNKGDDVSFPIVNFLYLYSNIPAFDAYKKDFLASDEFEIIPSKIFTEPITSWLTVMEYLLPNDDGYVPIVVTTNPCSFLRMWNTQLDIHICLSFLSTKANPDFLAISCSAVSSYPMLWFAYCFFFSVRVFFSCFAFALSACSRLVSLNFPFWSVATVLEAIGKYLNIA